MSAVQRAAAVGDLQQRGRGVVPRHDPHRLSSQGVARDRGPGGRPARRRSARRSGWLANAFDISDPTLQYIFGIFYVATKMGCSEYEKEDYGQTLGALGVGPGCYLVLPVLGPSTVRDTVGSLANVVGGDPWYNVTVANDTQHFSDINYWGTRVMTGIDFRAKNLDSFENLENNSMDFYASVRSLYLQDRQQKILNSKATTETMDDGDWEEIDTQ